jgi:hypothetical protein
VITPGDSKARRAIMDALNGDLETVDAAVRRSLFVITTLIDDQNVHAAAHHAEMIEALEEKTSNLERKVTQITRLLISTTVTFVIALATGLLNLVIN